MLELRTDHIVRRSEVKRQGTPSRTWTAVIFTGVTMGAVSGTLGILISLLTSVGAITRNRVSGNITVGLIVIALTSLLGAAHGMDKIREIEKREKHERFMNEVSKKANQRS